MNTIRIALIQQSSPPDRDDNRRRGIAAVERAANDGAQLVCFAELAFDPFYPQEPATDDMLARAERVPGPTVEPFIDLARALGVVIVLNVFELDGDRRYATSPVIDADGSLLGKTRMVHITDHKYFHERGYYEPGDQGAPVYDTAVGSVGVAIGYDRHYPEYMRALALGEAKLVVVPQAGALGEWPEALFESEVQVTAFQNGYYTALCNRTGTETSLAFAGESFVCDPAGKVIARAGRLADEILMCDINLEKVDESHARRLLLPDRRPELYADWLCGK